MGQSYKDFGISRVQFVAFSKLVCVCVRESEREREDKIWKLSPMLLNLLQQ